MNNNYHKYHYKNNDYKDKNPILSKLFNINNNSNRICNININYNNEPYIIFTYDTYIIFNNNQINFINQHLNEFELRELLLISKCLYKQNNKELLKIIFNTLKNKLGKLTNWKQIYIEFIKLDWENARFIYEHYFTNNFNINSEIEQLKYNIIIMMTLLKLIDYSNIDTIINQFYKSYLNEINELYDSLI